MIQDLHMLKEKNSKNCVYSSMLSPFIKMDKGYSFGYIEKKKEFHLLNFFLTQHH